MGSELDSAEPNATMIAAAVKLAKDSDVVILVLGDTPDEGDLASLLPLLHLPTHLLTYLLTYLLFSGRVERPLES